MNVDPSLISLPTNIILMDIVILVINLDTSHRIVDLKRKEDNTFNIHVDYNMWIIYTTCRKYGHIVENCMILHFGQRLGN